MVSSILCFGLTREFLFIWVLVVAAIPYGILIISLVLFSFRYDRQHTQDKYKTAGSVSQLPAVAVFFVEDKITS